MSYILESLKKSEKERNIAESSAALALSSAPFLENDRPKDFSLKSIGFVVFIVSILVLGYWYISSQNIQLVLVEQGNDLSLVNQSKVNQSKSISNEKEKIIAINAESEISKEEAVRQYQQALAGKSFPDVSDLYAKVDTAAEASSNSQPALDNTAVSGSDVNLEQTLNQAEKNSSESKSKEVIIPSIYDLESTYKRKLPEISYGAHVFASDLKSGFVILNGARRRIGDRLDNGIYIEKITEDDVILSYNGTIFSLPAMKNWTGN